MREELIYHVMLSSKLNEEVSLPCFHVPVSAGSRADTLGGSHGLGPLKLQLVKIHSDNESRTGHLGSLKNGQTESPEAKDDNALLWLHLDRVEHGAPACQLKN